MIDQNSRRVEIDPHHAARVIGDYCDHHGLPRRDVFTVSEACELLGRMGYVCTPGTVAEFVRKNYLPDPGDVWDCSSVYALAAGLESRRRWLPTPCSHDSKKTGIRLQLEQLAAEGVNPPVEGLDVYTLEDLLLQLTQSNNRHEREHLYEVLRLKLAGFEE